MGQQAHYGAQTCLGTNPRKCQDLGDSILLILGSFILLNVGINVVTLLWRNLKSSLRIIFHHFFPKDKQPSGVSSRPLCMHCTADPRSLYSRISSHFHRHPSLLLGHANHLDWMPGTNEEKVSRCCWMPPQCGHPIGPREAPRELWKERMVGSKKDPQVTSTRAQASLFSRPESSSQFPKMNKMDILPHALAQESKTKAPDYNPAHASAHICEQSLTQSQTRASEGTHFQAQDLEHASAEAPALIRPPSEVHSAAHASPPIPAPSLPCAPAQAPPPSQARLSAQALEQAQDQSPAPTIVQIAAFAPAPLPVQSLAPTPARGSAHTPEQTSAHTPAQDPVHNASRPQSQDPVQTPAQASTHSQADVLEQILSTVSAHTPAHSLVLSCAPTPAQGPISVPEPPSTLAPAISPAVASVHVCAPAPRSTSAAFNPSLCTGHVVYDARRAKQNMVLKDKAQNCRHPGRDLYAFSQPQEGQGLVNSGIPEKTSKQDGGGIVKPPAGSILSYLGLRNMEWKISDDAKDKLSQHKTVPHCSFHPSSTERKNADSQIPVYPKILLYAQDAAPFKPCFHSPSTAQSSLSTFPPPCTLSLPLVPPRTFVLPLSNPQKPPSFTQSPPTFLPACKSPLSVPTSYFPSSSQFPTVSQPLIQQQHSEGQGLMQEFDLQRILCVSNDSRFARNPGLTPNPSLIQNSDIHKKPGLTQNPGLIQNPDIHKNPGLNENPHLHMNLSPSHDSGLHKNPDITQDSGPSSSSGTTQDAGVVRNPCTPQHSDLHKNNFIQTSDQKSVGFMQNSGIYRNVLLNQNTAVYKTHLSRTTDQKRSGLSQDPGGYTNTGNVQDPESTGVYRSQGHTQDSEIKKGPGLDQESSPHKSQTSCIHKGSGLTQESREYKRLDFTQDSGIYKVADLTQDSEGHKSPGITQVTEVEKRLNLTQDVGICKSSEASQDPRLNKCSGANHDIDPQKDSALAHGSDLPKARCHTQEAGLHRKLSPVPGTDSAQVLDPLQTLKSTPSSMKSFLYKTAFQKKDAKHVSWTSVPINQNPCLPKAHVISTDQKAFSEVPVLIELQSVSQQGGSQDWVYNPVPSTCQSYRQMSAPPKINWRHHFPGSDARIGHVVFDARQRHSVMGRDKCEALCPRRLGQEAPSNAGEPPKEWGYQNVMRISDKQGGNINQK